MVKEFLQSSYALLRKARTPAGGPTEPTLSIGSEVWFPVVGSDVASLLVGWTIQKGFVLSVESFPW